MNPIHDTFKKKFMDKLIIRSNYPRHALRSKSRGRISVYSFFYATYLRLRGTLLDTLG
jgi:hypothetical protein